MKKSNVFRALLFAIILTLVLPLSTSAQTVSVGTLYMEDVGISYTNPTEIPLYRVSQDKFVTDYNGLRTVTMVFDLYSDEDWFVDAYELYRQGSLHKYDLLSIGYPNQLMYDTIELLDSTQLHIDRFRFVDMLYPTFMSEDHYVEGEASYDRDVWMYYARIKITYKQSASLPSVYNHDYGERGLPLAMTNDYVYLGDTNTSFNMVLTSQYLEDQQMGMVQAYIEPISISCTLGNPKVVSYSGDTADMTIYSMCTYFDVYNQAVRLFSQDGYFDIEEGTASDKFDEYYQRIELTNSYNRIISKEDETYPGGFGWFDLFESYYYVQGGIGTVDPNNVYLEYLETNSVTFSSGRDIEYWCNGVEFDRLYTSKDFVNQNQRFVIFCPVATPVDWEIIPSEALEEYAFYQMRPYVGAWSSHDITNGYNYTYDEDVVEGVDISDLYVEVSFDFPTFPDVDESHPVQSLLSGIFDFTKGIIVSLLKTVTSVLYNALVWLSMECPIVSDLIGPLFQIGLVIGNFFSEYVVPIFRVLRVFSVVLALPLILFIVKRLT